METTTRLELQERQITPLDLPSSVESLNTMNRQHTENLSVGSKFQSHSGSGYNAINGERISPKHNVFVLSVDGKPLTPTTNAKARKLLRGKQARPIWNKFSQFGIQMLVETRKETPKTVLGIDFGTKFEGYSLISGEENVLNIMLKLPNKKKLVNKLEERKQLRRTRRFRNCRRRKCRFNNRRKQGFIAPSQLQIVNSRIKCMNEFFKCYPIQKVAIENVCFNHRDNKWGKNFSTIEIGKQKIYNYIRGLVGTENLILLDSFNTQSSRKQMGLKKTQDKSSKSFYSHCVDSFVIANELSNAFPNEKLIYVDDNYRSIRRRLHDTQPTKGNIRAKFSTGNFKGIRKGTICEYGQIVGGTKEQIWYQDFELQGKSRKIYQKGKMLNKIKWLSHNYKNKEILG